MSLREAIPVVCSQALKSHLASQLGSRPIEVWRSSRQLLANIEKIYRLDAVLRVPTLRQEPLAFSICWQQDNNLWLVRLSASEARRVELTASSRSLSRALDAAISHASYGRAQLPLH